jgi:D-aspartate ligase
MTQVSTSEGIINSPGLATGSPVPVLVLKVGRLVLHHGGVGIIRSLGRIGIPVYSVVEDHFTPAALSRYLTGAIVWEMHGMDSNRFLEGMAIIGEKLGHPTIVIPTDDMGAILLAEHAETLRQWFAFPQVPATLPRTLANKRELYRLCQEWKMPCPFSVFPNSPEEITDLIEHASYPIVIKAAESWSLPAGIHTTTVAWNVGEARAYCENAGKLRRPNLIFQEFIAPAYGEDWFYHGYRNGASGRTLGFTGRKARSYPSYAGPTTLGHTERNDSLRRQTEAFLEKIGYSGIMDLDYRLDKRDGEYKLVDFNPRIGAQFRLFEDSAGVDLAQALYFDLAGVKVAGAIAEAKPRTFVAEFHDLVASVAHFRQGRLNFRQWVRSLRGAKERAWFSWDDLLPFLTVCVRLPFSAIRRLLGLRFRPIVSNLVPQIQMGRGHKKTGNNYKYSAAHPN